VARAIWKGALVIGRERVPVKLYSAIESSGVHFRLLHEPDRVPVEQHMVNPETDDVVPSDRVRRGYEVEAGTFVVLDEEDLEQAEPEPSRDIELLRFLPLDEIDGRWYDRPYYLGPDGSDEAYFACCEAVRQREVEGLARWTMRKKEYLGSLRERDGHLLLVTLRHAGEVVDAGALPAPSGRRLDEREVAMAEQLVSALAGPFEAEQFRDEYRERVEELIASKAEGRELQIERPEPAPQEASLEEALRRSVEGARKQDRPDRRPAGRKERRSA
jgi:DNA end-binding protein Ku